MKEYNLEIKKEFKEFLNKLTENELKLLEADILKNGIQDKIIVGVIEGEKYIIDGHNRYYIAKKHKLDYEVLEMDFESEEAIKIWMFERQLGKRNLNVFSKCEIILNLYKIKRDDADYAKKILEINQKYNVSTTNIRYVSAILEAGNENINILCREGTLPTDVAYASINKRATNKELNLASQRIVRSKKMNDNTKKELLKKINKLAPKEIKSDCITYLKKENNTSFNLAIIDFSNYPEKTLEELCEVLLKKSNENAEFYFFCECKNYRRYSSIIEKYFNMQASIVYDFQDSVQNPLCSLWRSRYRFIIYATKGYTKHLRQGEDVIIASKKREVIDEILDTSNDKETKVLQVYKTDNAVISGCVDKNIEVITFCENIKIISNSLKEPTFRKKKA